MRDDILIDMDGNEYKTVKIGNQLWLAENLRVKHYRNGDDIPYVSDGEKWSKTTSGACCALGNEKHFEGKYGLLYNGYAVTDKRNIAPEGWRIPSAQDFVTLIDFLNHDDGVGDKLKYYGGDFWVEYNKENVQDSGFHALPGGFRSVNDHGGGGDFFGKDSTFARPTRARFWTSTEDTAGPDFALYVQLLTNSEKIAKPARGMGQSKNFGCSVRLLKDA